MLYVVHRKQGLDASNRQLTDQNAIDKAKDHIQAGMRAQKPTTPRPHRMDASDDVQPQRGEAILPDASSWITSREELLGLG